MARKGSKKGSKGPGKGASALRKAKEENEAETRIPSRAGAAYPGVRLWAVVFRVRVWDLGAKEEGASTWGRDVSALGSGFRLQAKGLQAFGFSLWGFRLQGCRVQGLGFRGFGLGLRV